MKVFAFKLKKKVKRHAIKYFFLIEQNKKLKQFRKIHQGKDFLIMGAGPSLDELPHEFLKNFIVIGTNKTFKYYTPDYWVVIDAQFSWMEEGRNFCNQNNIPAFINWVWAKTKPFNKLPNEVNMYSNRIPVDQSPNNLKLKNILLKLYSNPDYIEKNGLTSVSNVVSEGAIPLALYMGCKNIYLAGVDFYTPKDHEVFSMKRSNEDQQIINQITKRFQEESNSKKDMWEYKKWTIELISESDIKNRVFNLSSKSSVENIPKISYNEVLSDQTILP